MDRHVWMEIRAALRGLPRTRTRNAVYTDAEVLAVLLWAAMHDRPVSWACRRSSWPMQAWRRRLPDQSTMSRRLRSLQIVLALWQLTMRLQAGRVAGDVLVVDGKPLEISEHSTDPEARSGRGAGRYARGYKLHLIADPRRRVFVACDRRTRRAAAGPAEEAGHRAGQPPAPPAPAREHPHHRRPRARAVGRLARLTAQRDRAAVRRDGQRGRRPVGPAPVGPPPAPRPRLGQRQTRPRRRPLHHPGAGCCIILLWEGVKSE